MRKFAILALFLSGCVSAPPVAPLAAERPAAPPQAPAPSAVVPPKALLEENELRDRISEWIFANDQASYAQAAAFANKALRKWGYPFVLDAAPLVGKRQDFLRLQAGGRVFELKAGHELSASPEPCGERFLRLHAKQVSANRALLVSGGKDYPFSLASFRREKARIWSGKRLLAVLSLPEPTEPMGISPDGKALFLRFPVDERRTAAWWSRITRQLSDVAGEDPYLVLRVERGQLAFEPEEKYVLPQEFEVAESEEDTIRWRFQNHVLELSSRCEGNQGD